LERLNDLWCAGWFDCTSRMDPDRPTPWPSTACGEAERPARLPDARRSGVAARKHTSEARHLQATRRVQGRVGPAEAKTLQVFSHFFTPKPRARSRTPHRPPRVNRPPAAAELPDVAAPGAQRTRRGMPPSQRASLTGGHDLPSSTRGRPCCGGRRHQVLRRLQAGADIDGPERRALAATAMATAQPPAPGSRGHNLVCHDDLAGETRRVARHLRRHPGRSLAGSLFTSGASAGDAEPGSERGRRMYGDEAAARCAATKKLSGRDNAVELVASSCDATTPSLKLTHH